MKRKKEIQVPPELVAREAELRRVSMDATVAARAAEEASQAALRQWQEACRETDSHRPRVQVWRSGALAPMNEDYRLVSVTQATITLREAGSRASWGLREYRRPNPGRTQGRPLPADHKVAWYQHPGQQSYIFPDSTILDLFKEST